MTKILPRTSLALALGILAGCGSDSRTATSLPTTPQTPLAARALAANDVSVLFPLGRGDLWSASMAGRDGGAVFPRAAFNLITLPLIQGLPGGDAAYLALRVVSLRFDPCFGGAPCYPQIRLVFQALTDDGASTRDGAVHALYNLTAGEFAALTAGLGTAAAQAPENQSVTRLEVSPALSAQGMSGPYALSLRDLVARYIGSANLAKVTFMTRAPGGGDRWDFGGFNLRDFVPEGGFPIAGLNGNVLVQTVREIGRGGGGPGGLGHAYSVTPGILRGELDSVLTLGAAQNASASERQRAMDALARVENPQIETADTVDCSACHLANRIRGSLQASFGLSSALSFLPDSEAARLIGGAERDNDNLRAFGYFGASPAISQRTANETRIVLSMMR
jgi:hypothetical protein